MQGGIFWIISIECVAHCRRHLLGIAIDINELGATIERPIPYALNTIAYSNRSQARATFESKLPYARHTIRDSNRAQIRTIRVFTTYCLPNCCDLNGRKVMT